MNVSIWREVISLVHQIAVALRRRMRACGTVSALSDEHLQFLSAVPEVKKSQNFIQLCTRLRVLTSWMKMKP